MSSDSSVRYADPGRSRRLRALPFFALRQPMRETYSKVHLKNDVLAGLVVGVLALPLSMALAIAVNAPPQRGLYTAIELAEKHLAQHPIPGSSSRIQPQPPPKTA